jgi:hypothetical protein
MALDGRQRAAMLEGVETKPRRRRRRRRRRRWEVGRMGEEERERGAVAVKRKSAEIGTRER